MAIVKKYWVTVSIFLIVLIGLFVRLYKIGFGLPYSFLYDETDIYDNVIRYAFNYKFIMAENNLEGFSPTSYVYGMFPTYFLTFCTMALNKLISIFKFSVDFDFYFVYMRIATSLFSFGGVIFTTLIAKKLFKNSKYFLLTFLLAALNWKLAAHSHYLNQDTYLMVFFMSSIYFLTLYLSNGEKSKKIKEYIPLVVSSLLMGLATGTKITALIVIPVIFLVMVLKKDFKSIFLYSFGTFIGFALSNPFSIIYFSSFISRLVLMRSIEAGAVFSSVNTNPFKYIFSLFHLLTPPIFILSVIGIYESIKDLIKKYKDRNLDSTNYSHIILVGSVLIYTIFFSLTPRLTDRWMLPIIPILVIYSVLGFITIEKLIEKRKLLNILFITVTAFIYIFYSFNLLNQLSIGKPRVNAYIWAKEYFNKTENLNSKVLMYTNKGDRDPFNKIKNIEMEMLRVYESRGAADFYPKDPINYGYIIVHSSYVNNFKNSYVMNKYPDYFKAWLNFDNAINDKSKFKIIKEFKTTKLDLIGVPEIVIYEKLK